MRVAMPTNTWKAFGIGSAVGCEPSRGTVKSLKKRLVWTSRCEEKSTAEPSGVWIPP